jgi:hypothetical protein
MTACGRKRPLKTVEFEHSERPLSGKAVSRIRSSPPESGTDRMPGRLHFLRIADKVGMLGLGLRPAAEMIKFVRGAP